LPNAPEELKFAIAEILKESDYIKKVEKVDHMKYVYIAKTL